jgi:DNA topoisomerase VI subunit B
MPKSAIKRRKRVEMSERKKKSYSSLVRKIPNNVKKILKRDKAKFKLVIRCD